MTKVIDLTASHPGEWGGWEGNGDPDVIFKGNRGWSYRIFREDFDFPLWVVEIGADGTGRIRPITKWELKTWCNDDVTFLVGKLPGDIVQQIKEGKK